MPLAIVADNPQLTKIAGEIRAGIIRRVKQSRKPNQQELLQMVELFNVLDDADVDGLRFGADTVNMITEAMELNYGQRATDEVLLPTKKPS